MAPATDAATTAEAGDGDGASAADSATLYVSGTTGDDRADGRSPTFALRTVKAALARVNDGASEVREIHVCAGEYAEPNLELRVPVALRGGYSCTTWARPEGFGFPTFATTFATKLIAPEDARDKTDIDVTLVVAPPAGHGAFVVDGFWLENRSKVAAAWSLHVLGGERSLVLRDLLVKAGAPTTAQGIASIGALLEESAAEMTAVAIAGGDGATNATATGTVGLYVANRGPLVHDIVVRAGAGVGNPGASGVLVSGTTSLSFSDSTIEVSGAVGRPPSGAGLPSKAVVLFDAAGTFERNLVATSGTSCAAPATACIGVGLEIVKASQPGELVVKRNTVALGPVAWAAPSLEVQGLAVSAATATPVRIEANVVHAGGFAGTSRAAVLLAPGPLSLLGNTFFSGTGSTASDALDGLLLGPGQATIRGNLFVGGGGSGVGLRGFQSSGAQPFATFEDNGFVGFPTEASITYDGFAHTQLSLVSASTVVRGAGQLYTAPAPDAVRNDVLAHKLAPAPTFPCALAQGWATLGQGSQLDFTGKPRTLPASIGAHEVDGPCAP